MIDLHCHILPGVDDGAETMEDACEMAYMAYLSGVTTIVATPHCMPGRFENYQTEEYEQAIAALQRELTQCRIPVTILPGAEAFAGDTLLEKLVDKQVPSLNGTNYLLTEFSFEEDIDIANSYLEQMVSLGYRPVIAHPERFEFVQREMDVIPYWKSLGYLLQSNKGSVLGRFGRRARRVANWMLEYEYVDIIASDAHSSWSRTPHMGEIYQYLCRYYGKEYALQLLKYNPQKVIQNELILSGRSKE